MTPQTTNTVSFHCTICEEPSERICVYCTKDTCENHICDKCLRCSDCCTCEVPLDLHINGHAAAVPTVAESRMEIISETVVVMESAAEAIVDAVPDEGVPEPPAEEVETPPESPTPASETTVNEAPAEDVHTPAPQIDPEKDTSGG